MKNDDDLTMSSMTVSLLQEVLYVYDVFKITKNPFYTLNIDRITKPQNFNDKNISIRHMKQKKSKNIV